MSTKEIIQDCQIRKLKKELAKRKVYDFTLTVDGVDYSETINYGVDFGAVEFPNVTVYIDNGGTYLKEDLVIEYIDDLSFKIISNDAVSGKVRVSN